jgi:hypothetical protein
MGGDLAMRIDRIVVTGDVFRTSDGDPNQIPNALWLQEELAGALYDLTGLPPAVAYRRNAADYGRALITEWFGLLGHAPSLAAWVATYGETAPPDLAKALEPDYERALVIGFELSPLMRSALDRLGVPWIDMELSPLRFLSDLALSVRCSWPVDRSDHPGLIVPAQVAEAVAGQRAQHLHDAAATACNGTCIFIAQTCYDRTLIRDGAFFPDGEAVQGVKEALDGRHLVAKPHPLQPDNPLIGTLREELAASVTDANIYALLAAASDVRFVTISSSAAIEARHFGHSPRILHQDAHAPPAPFTSLWAHMSAAFWRPLLAPLLPVRADAAFEARSVPDRLRRKIGAWGFARTPAHPRTDSFAIAAATADALESA